jgi:hypothetical protein
MTKKIIISAIVSTAILFLWNGLTQLFPWGVPAAQTITAQKNKRTEGFQTRNLIELPPNSLTTEQFDRQFENKISTLTTGKTFSWIISKPISYYNAGQYFIKEIITQLIVSLLLTLILLLTAGLNDRTRLIIIGIAGASAVAAIYGQMMNWWGVPAIYALGAGFNMIAGWLVVAFALTKWIIKTKIK